MRPRTLLFLLVAVLGLGTFIWFYERELPSSEEREKLSKRVFDVDKDDVTAVTLQSEGRTVRLEKVKTDKGSKDEKDNKDNDELDLEPEAEWWLTQPLKARADSFAVSGLLDALTALEQTREMEDVDPKEAGLDRPRATVRLKTDEGETVLDIGAADPMGGGSTLAAVKGRKGAYVVSDSILTEIQRQPGDWRDKQMYRGNRDEVRRITLVSGGQRVVLAAQGKDGQTYRIESPFADRADQDKVDDLFAELSGLTAESFMDTPARPLAELGLQPPKAVVEVAFDKGAPPVRIEVGDLVEQEMIPEETPVETPLAKPVYARIGTQLFEARTRLADAAARPVAEWRAQTLSALDVFEVESATVQDGKGTLSLQRAEPDWKRGAETISYLPVSDFLFALVGSRAERLLAPAEAGAMGISLAKPSLTVTLKTKEKGQEVLSLYPPVAAGVPARTSGRNVVLLLPASTLGELEGKLAEVRKAKPVTAKKE
jgi:hypothetical protein